MPKDTQILNIESEHRSMREFADVFAVFSVAKRSNTPVRGMLVHPGFKSLAEVNFFVEQLLSNFFARNSSKIICFC